MEYFDGSHVFACQTLANTFWSALYFLSSIALFFLLPLLLLLAIYFVIARHLVADAARVRLHKHADAAAARRQVVLMLAAVVLCFFICLCPFRLFIAWIILVEDDSITKLGIERYYNILYFSRMLVYINSAVNPILYNLMSSKFRQGFLLCGVGGRRRRRERDRSAFGNSVRSTSTFRTMSREVERDRGEERGGKEPVAETESFV